MIEKLLNFGRKLIPKKLFRLGQPVYHFLLALSGNIIYGFPGKRLICIGITGTNGKSTTVELVNSVLKKAGYKTGMLSTVAFEIAGERKENLTARTTLGRWQTPKLLRKMVKAGVEYAVLEVASEGIVQFRTWGIPFDAAVFTNLSPEHLNTHKTMSRYRNAKGKLFSGLSQGKKRKKIKEKKVDIKKASIVNADDREAKYFSAFPADIHIGYGIKKGEVRAVDIAQDKGLKFNIMHAGKKYGVSSKLLGEFNVYNLLAAFSVGISQGVEPKTVIAGLQDVELIEGRMQEIPNSKGIRVFVDYAMTPDSYEMLFREMRKMTTGRLITVFGAAGGKDKSKRPKIGEIAAKMTDHVILTEDEPYNEDPDAITSEIEEGVKKVSQASYEIVMDREKALHKAIKMAQKGDVIVVPGMGHEKSRNIGGAKRIPWNDAEIIGRLLRK